MKAITRFQGVPNGEFHPVTYEAGDEVPPELEATANHFAELAGGPPRDADGLRTDGPTVAEYVEAGYRASNYPPKDFASRSTEDEISAYVAAQQPPVPLAETPAPAASSEPPAPAPEPGADDADPAKLTIPEIKAKLDAAGIKHGSGLSKADLLALLPKD